MVYYDVSQGIFLFNGLSWGILRQLSMSNKSIGRQLRLNETMYKSVGCLEHDASKPYLSGQQRALETHFVSLITTTANKSQRVAYLSLIPFLHATVSPGQLQTFVFGVLGMILADTNCSASKDNVVKNKTSFIGHNE